VTDEFYAKMTKDETKEALGARGDKELVDNVVKVLSELNSLLSDVSSAGLVIEGDFDLERSCFWLKITRASVLHDSS